MDSAFAAHPPIGIRLHGLSWRCARPFPALAWRHALGGACYEALVASRPAGFAGFDDKDLQYGWKVLRFAGLLHDVGHAPFSHTAEAFYLRLKPCVYQTIGTGMVVPAHRQATHEDCSLGVIYGLVGEGVLDEGWRETSVLCCLRTSVVGQAYNAWEPGRYIACSGVWW